MAVRPSTPERQAGVSRTRKGLYAQLGIAKRDLGWDEARYRQHLAEHGALDHQGRPSAATMSFAQLEAALGAMRTMGWKPTQGGSILARCHRARRNQWAKVIALWCTLANAGEVTDRSESAMLNWARRHIRSDRIEWADAYELSKCIEALIAWAERKDVHLEVPRG